MVVRQILHLDGNLDTQECGWWLDRHPVTGQLINGLPGFMLPGVP